MFAVFALLMGIAAFAYLTLWPSFEIIETNADGVKTSRRGGIGESNGILGVVFALIPVLITLGAILSVPPNGQSERRHKLNLIVGTILVVGLHIAVRAEDRHLVRSSGDNADIRHRVDAGARSGLGETRCTGAHQERPRVARRSGEPCGTFWQPRWA